MKKTIDGLIQECEGFINELKNHCVESMFSREYSWRAKYPFKVMSFVHAMTWRMYDMSNAALTLMKQDTIIPSLCLVRASWENMVAIYELRNVVEDCCEKHTVSEDVDDVLMRLLYSNRFEKDNRYVGEEHYENFRQYKAKNILTLVQKLEKDIPEVKDFYSNICEFVHPNSDGVCGSYSFLDENTHTTTFGPQINRQSELFPAFISTLSGAIAFYLEFIESLEGNIEEFTGLYEEALAKIANQGEVGKD